VPPRVVRDNSPLRPLSHPHQEEIGTVPQDGKPHRFTLVAVIGGKGLAVSPGELSVSVRTPEYRRTEMLILADGLVTVPVMTNPGPLKPLGGHRIGHQVGHRTLSGAPDCQHDG